MFIRFSTVAGERGAADAERDIRGFAMVLYRRGSWDLVGNDTPVFYLRDPLKFPDLSHVVKRGPAAPTCTTRSTNGTFSPPCRNRCQLTIDFSDRGIPKSLSPHAASAYTFSFISTANERFWVKFHFRCQQGIENLDG